MRIIAFGDAALMDGFALLGIETHANPKAEAVETILTKLVRSRERALVFVQQELMTDAVPIVAQLRNQGGSILICELPALHCAEHYKPQVERLIARVLGPSTMEPGIGD